MQELLTQDTSSPADRAAALKRKGPRPHGGRGPGSESAVGSNAQGALSPIGKIGKVVWQFSFE